MLTNTNTPLKTIAVVAAIAIAPLSLSAPAIAAGPDDTVTITIKASDLTNTNGVMGVYEAFQTKAERACEQNGARNLQVRKFEKICTADLVDDFVVDLNDPNVFEVHYNGTVTVE